MYLDATAQTARNWTVAGIAVYRCELIDKTTNSKRELIFKTKNRVVLIWIIGLIILGITALPRGFEIGFVIEKICEKPILYKIGRLKELLMGFSNYKLLYRGLFLFLVQSGGPVITVIIMSIIIIRKLKPQIQNCRNPVRRARRKNSNRMVIYLCIIFIFLEMPAFISKLMEAIPKVDFLIIRFLGIVSNLSTTLETFSIFGSFIISNKEFRSRLLSVLFITREVERETRVIKIDLETSIMNNRLKTNDSNTSINRTQYVKTNL